MSDPDLPLTGHCLCGGVRFEITEPLVDSAYCHCTRCQRRTGGPFAVSDYTRPGSMKITEGEDLVTTFDPGQGFLKSFCSICGGHLYSENPDDPSQRAVRLGALDQDPGIRPSLHQFTEYAASWEPLPDDGLPRYPERRPT